MSLAVTLFGGAIAIIVLYYALAALKLSNYWRGVISALLPLTAYAVYFARHTPGGDVLSVHVAVYLATAGVLMALGMRTTDGKKRLHWAPVAIVGFFAVIIVIQAVLLVISSHGLPDALARVFLPGTGKVVHTAFPGVVPHSQDAAKSISQYLKQEELKRRTGWQIEVAGLDKARLNAPQHMVVRLTDSAGRPVDTARLQLKLRPPELGASAQQVPLNAAGAGRYEATANFPHPGPWTAMLSIEAGSERYEAQRVVQVTP